MCRRASNNARYRKSYTAKIVNLLYVLPPLFHHYYHHPPAHHHHLFASDPEQIKTSSWAGTPKQENCYALTGVLTIQYNTIPKNNGNAQFNPCTAKPISVTRTAKGVAKLPPTITSQSDKCSLVNFGNYDTMSSNNELRLECSGFNPNWFTFGGVIAERVNTAKSRPQVNPIFGRSLASSRINMCMKLQLKTNRKSYAVYSMAPLLTTR